MSFRYSQKHLPFRTLVLNCFLLHPKSIAVASCYFCHIYSVASLSFLCQTACGKPPHILCSLAIPNAAFNMSLPILVYILSHTCISQRSPGSPIGIPHRPPSLSPPQLSRQYTNIARLGSTPCSLERYPPLQSTVCVCPGLP